MNSPGGTTNNLPETMWVHGKPCLNEEIRIQKYEFCCLWLSVSYENWRGGPQDFDLCLYYTYASIKQIIVLERSKRCIFDGFSQFVATKLTFQKFNPSQSARWMCDRRAVFSFFYCIASCTRITLDFGREVASLGFKLSHVCKSCSLTIYLTVHSPELQIVSLQSHGLIFQINLSWVAGKRFVHGKHCTHIFLVI